jgi:hypothetical protein
VECRLREENARNEKASVLKRRITARAREAHKYKGNAAAGVLSVAAASAFKRTATFRELKPARSTIMVIASRRGRSACREIQ